MALSRHICSKAWRAAATAFDITGGGTTAGPEASSCLGCDSDGEDRGKDEHEEGGVSSCRQAEPLPREGIAVDDTIMLLSKIAKSVLNSEPSQSSTSNDWTKLSLRQPLGKHRQPTMIWSYRSQPCAQIGTIANKTSMLDSQLLRCNYTSLLCKTLFLSTGR